MCVCAWLLVDVLVHVYVYYVYVYVYVCMCMYVYVCMCVCIYLCMYVAASEGGSVQGTTPACEEVGTDLLFKSEGP